MNYNFLLILPILFLWGTRCENVTKVENSTGKASANIGRRADYNYAYAELVTCAVRYDTACLVNAAEDFLDIKRQELLAQADQEVMKSTGRADPGNTPSHLAKTIEKLLSELAGFFKNGLSSLFRDAEDDDEVVDADEKDDENDDEKEDGETRDVNGESRKKKKKKGPIKKLFAVIKVGVVAAVFIIKICLLIKLFEAALKFKLLVVSVASFVLQAFKFWFDFKGQGHSHDESVVYKSPYESAGEWNGPGSIGSGGVYARTYDTDEDKAQDLAYSQYRPRRFL